MASPWKNELLKGCPDHDLETIKEKVNQLVGSQGDIQRHGRSEVPTIESPYLQYSHLLDLLASQSTCTSAYKHPPAPPIRRIIYPGLTRISSKMLATHHHASLVRPVGTLGAERKHSPAETPFSLSAGTNVVQWTLSIYKRPALPPS